MLKTRCIPNHTLFYDGLRQHLALAFHRKSQKINDLNQTCGICAHFRAAPI